MEIKKRQQLTILRRFLWMLLIVIIYMLGRKITVPTIVTSQPTIVNGESVDLLNNLVAVTGANFNGITLFTLGVSPWMTAMILWRFFIIVGWFKNLTSKQQHYAQMSLTLVIAYIQAFGTTMNMQFPLFASMGDYGNIIGRLLTMLVLITGSFLLIWLGNVNGQRGLGGMMIIILTNMLLAFETNLTKYLLTVDDTNVVSTLLVIICLLCIITTITVVLYLAEYRIPIKHVAVNNAYNKGSYLPIRLMPAGAMPFMYGMTLMMLPPFILSLLLSIFPGNEWLILLATNIGVSRLPGVVLYMVLLYILAVGFAYYNYDAQNIAKNMRQTGDYIESVRPGKATTKYIQAKVTFWAHFGAWFAVLMGGVPLFVVVWQNTTSEANITLALLVSNILIVSSLMMGIIEQVNMLRSWKKYKDVI